MRDTEELLDQVYAGQDRIDRDELYRRFAALDVSAEVLMALDALPEGAYAQDETAEALADAAPPPPHARAGGVDPAGVGIPAPELPTPDLLRELAELHATRTDTLRHGSAQALATHTVRTAELEDEYLDRFPDREVDPARLRAGARER